ncbi:hypothetical protein K3G69_14925 [Phytobacter diazotrophicus]|nr:hypothetical protein [Phytobacter diazotrophicus]
MMKTRPAGGKRMQDNDDGIPRAKAVITVLHWLALVAECGCIVWICIGCGDSSPPGEKTATAFAVTGQKSRINRR